MRKTSLACLIVAVLMTSFATGCVRKRAASAPPPVATDAANSAVAFLNKSFVVAPFSIPATDGDLLAGFLPAKRFVPDRVLGPLDAALAQDLAMSKQTILPARMGAACVKSAPRGDEPGRLGTLRYWQNVGKCAGADYVLVPLLINWHEREGSEIGSTAPAGVNLTLTLLDVRTGGIVKHYHFDETQKPLTANLLDAPKFMARKGRWLSALDLAQEGLKQGITELGL